MIFHLEVESGEADRMNGPRCTSDPHLNVEKGAFEFDRGRGWLQLGLALIPIELLSPQPAAFLVCCNFLWRSFEFLLGLVCIFFLLDDVLCPSSVKFFEDTRSQLNFNNFLSRGIPISIFHITETSEEVT